MPFDLYVRYRDYHTFILHATMSFLDLPADFDPRYQLLNYTSVEGPFSITFADIDDYYHNRVKNGIIFGTRIGAAGLAMIVLWLTSTNKKTPVFILNQLSLFFLVLHSGLYINFLLGGYSSITLTFTGFTDYLITQRDLNVYAVTNVFQLLLTATIEASMVFQVKTIFSHPEGKMIGYPLVGVSLLVALATIGLYFFNTVKSITELFGDHQSIYQFNIQTILFASSVNFMSLILVTKLVMAIRSRRYLGLKQFDSFHILLIMSTQTMIIPSVLTILSYALPSFQTVALPAVSVLLTTLSLPLSSMWAASANNSPTPTSSGYNIYTPSTIKGSIHHSEHGTTLKGDIESSKSRHFRRYPYDIYSHGSSINERGGEDFEEKDLFTPSTAAEEEAKRYWFAAEEETGDDEFIAKTTHQINGGSRP